MKTYIQSFCEEFEFPQEATEFLLESYDKVLLCTPVNNMLIKYLISYKEEGNILYLEALEQLKENAPLCGISYYTLHFLYCICMTKELKKRYQEHHIPDNVCYDTLKDLRYKLFECHNVYGIWGTFVASWWRILFGLQLYTLGRLEFEVCNSPVDYHEHGFAINSGDTILQVHIPSSGPFPHDACTESYHMAKDFFKTLFVGRKTYFMCHSWLLFPEHEKMLPANSNIRKFADDYIIYSHRNSDYSEDLWRIFGKEIKTTADCAEPQTSLQRSYLDWLEQGNSTGIGMGLMAL